MGRKPNNKPSFFKIMFGDFTEKLKLPLAFLKHFTGRLPKEVVLEIATGTCWVVKIERIENSMFFVKGWQGFIDDNAIEIGDLLVFRLFGKSKFYVRIYDKTCCEKESIVEQTSRRKEKQGIVSGKSVERTSPGKKSYKSSIAKNRKVMNTEKVKVLDVQTQECKMKTRLDLQGGQTAKPDESGTAVRKEALLLQVAKGYETSSIVPWNIRKAVTPQQNRAYEAAHQFKSDYPFFIMKMSKCWVHGKYMNLPMGFVRTYLPDESKCGEIIDVKGRTWLVKYTRPNFKRASICGGWSAVRSENDLEEDNVCAFELVDKDNLKLKISVLYPKNKRMRLKPSITC